MSKFMIFMQEVWQEDEKILVLIVALLSVVVTGFILLFLIKKIINFFKETKKEKNTLFANKVIEDVKNPFNNNFLSPDGQLENFANTIEKLAVAEKFKCEASGEEKSFIVSVAATYGRGKTTFVDRWGTRIKNNGGIAIKFDALKYDYMDNPYLPFFAEIQKQLIMYGEKFDLKKIKNELNKILPCIIETSGVVASVISSAKGIPVNFTTVSSMINKKLDGFKNLENKLDEFRKILLDIVNSSKKKAIYIFIDELDRCNPLFSIRLIETIKHLFNVSGIVFVLTLNNEYLEAIIRKIYGFGDGDLPEYFGKYIDRRLYLPRLAEKDYAASLLQPNLQFDQDNLDCYFKNKKHTIDIKEMCIAVFQGCCHKHSFNLNLREIEKISDEISFFIAVNKDIENLFLPSIIYFICLKNKNYMVYAGGESIVRESSQRPIFNNILFKEMFEYTNWLLCNSLVEDNLSKFLARNRNECDLQGIEQYFDKIYSSSGVFYANYHTSNERRKKLTSYKPSLKIIKGKIDYISSISE